MLDLMWSAKVYRPQQRADELILFELYYQNEDLVFTWQER